jgi:hypothetical protein
MQFLLNSVPYFLAGFTILLALFQLRKVWNEYNEHKWLRIGVIAVLIAVASLTFVSLNSDKKEKEEDRSRSEGDIRDLKGEVKAANNAQSENTKLFLGSFDAMSKELADLKAEAKTEDLQKKLAGVQAELQRTQRALAPGPKAELTFTFAPFASTTQTATPVTDITLPIKPDGTVHVECAVLNLTQVDAADVNLNIQICDGCKYAKEPDQFQKLAGAPETIRWVLIPHIQALQAFRNISIDIIPAPAPYGESFDVGLNYRCTTCIIPKDLIRGTVHVSRP